MSEAARRYFGCVLPIVLIVAGCGVAGMLAYAGRIIIEERRVTDRAMAPWLEPGVRALVFHVLLWANDPERGTIVDALTPDGRTFRRLVALPGDEVEIRDGHLWLNGRESDPAARPTGTGPDFGPVTMGPDDYFLLSDDRSLDDSRVWGPLPRARIFGEPRFKNDGDGWLPVEPGIDLDWRDRTYLERDATATAAAEATATARAGP